MSPVGGQVRVVASVFEEHAMFQPRILIGGRVFSAKAYFLIDEDKAIQFTVACTETVSPTDSHPADSKFDDAWLEWTKRNLAPPSQLDCFRMGWESRRVDPDTLAQTIREVDGDHTLGAADLAEKIIEKLP